MGSETQFNYSDYDRLDGASLQDMVAQFLMRNKSFMQDYRMLDSMSIEQKGTHIVTMGEKYGVIVVPSDLNIIKDFNPEVPKIVLPSPVTALRYVAFNDSDVKDALRNDCLNAFKKGISDAAYYHDGMELEREKTDILDYLGIWRKNGIYCGGDRLVLSIDLNKKMFDVYHEIRKILDIHYKHLTSQNVEREERKRFKEWKKYLIIYDLITDGNEPFEVAEIIAPHYPSRKKDEKEQLERTISYGYGECLKLISGGYKKYI